MRTRLGNRWARTARATSLGNLDRRTGRPPGASAHHPTDEVEARCWCDRTTVLIPIALVSHGLTDSCGRKGCSPPA